MTINSICSVGKHFDDTRHDYIIIIKGRKKRLLSWALFSVQFDELGILINFFITTTEKRKKEGGGDDANKKK